MTPAVAPADSRVRPLPERSVLVHIGPHKTGTTYLQEAFSGNSAALLEGGIVYPGGGRQHQMPGAINIEAKKAAWSDRDCHEIVRRGIVRHLHDRVPEDGESRILTPEWALLRAAATSRCAVEEIAASGVAVVGQLASLCHPWLQTGRPDGQAMLSDISLPSACSRCSGR